MTSPEIPADPSLPREIGRYTLFDKIGRGGMADIYLARAQTDLGVSRLVVVKQILPHLADSREFSDLLVTEAKLAARLDHANVVQVHDLGRSDGFLYITMQYVEGFDLTELLRRCSRTKTPLPVQYALLIVIEVLRGLDYAHRRTNDAGEPLGIVHRDVSPSNILISLDGEVKLCDFGIAHANDAAGPAYSDDVIKGKAGYMSPEQANGDPLDARADVFAAGIVLWELLSGRRLYRVAAGEPPLLEQARLAKIPALVARGLPAEERLVGIVMKALAPRRDERYPSAAAMLRELEDYVADAKLVASPLRFGEWLLERFGEELIRQRRERERAIGSLGTGAKTAPLSASEREASAPVPATAPVAAAATEAADSPRAQGSSIPTSTAEGPGVANGSSGSRAASSPAEPAPPHAATDESAHASPPSAHPEWPVRPASAYQSTRAPQPTHTSGAPWFAVIALLLLVVLAAIAYWFIARI